MKMKKIIAALLTFVMCFSMIAVNVNTADTVKAAGEEGSSRVEEIIDNMTLRQKITQMIMPDFRKWTLDVNTSDAEDFTVMNDEVGKIIEDYDFGGIILFANNVKTTEQSFNLVHDMQEAATKDNGIPLLIGIDQEGGIVYRLGSGSAMPGNMAIGATGSTEMSRNAGQIIGRELSALGINTNFAPDVDVNDNPNNPVIGLRSFGDDPEMVAELGVAMIQGMNDYNIIISAKHFPGHGNTATDSHTGLPVVNKTLDELKECELVPFQAAMDAGTDMFMVAHICYPKVDDTKVISSKTGEEVGIPATVSKKILTDLVRNDMNYDGVLITDAMNMQGLSDIFGQVEASIRSIEAGIDILLMPCVLYDDEEDIKDLDAIIEGIENAVAEGRLTEERLEESVRRILTLKEKRGVLDYNASDYSLEKANAAVGSEQNRQEEREISAAAVTVIKNDGYLLPLQPEEGSKVLLLGAYDNELPGLELGMRRVQAESLAQGVEYESFRYSSATTEEELRAKIEATDYVICISEVGSASQMMPEHWITKQPTLVSDISAELGKKCIIVSISKPYDVQHYDNADAIVAVYGNKGMDPTEGLVPDAAFGPNITAGVEVIFGVFGAQGKLPVTVQKFDEATTSYTEEVVYNRGYGLTYISLIGDLPYEDVSTDDWFYDYVYDVYVKALMTGLDETTFGPANELKRAHFATILYRMEGEPEVVFEDTFADMKDGHFYSDAVIWASQNGIVTGYTDTGLFGPNDNITREQMAAMMWRYAQYKNPELKGLEFTEEIGVSGFPDGDKVQPFADNAMKWCVAEQIIQGKGEEPKILDPQGDTNRAECATIISRYIEAVCK